MLVDGKAVVSCAQKATRIEGKHVVTQEGLGEDVREAWAKSFVVAGASQCGFCSPGIVMKAEALLAKNPEPSRDEISRALLGNLCRCTGYVKVLDAIELAPRARCGEPLPELDDTAGSARVRRATRATSSRSATSRSWATCRRRRCCTGPFASLTIPARRILRIDTSKAEAHPGVVAVRDRRGRPRRAHAGTLTQDWRQFVAEGETTAYVGDVLAAVAAETRHAAREAAALVDVEYEVLEPVTDPFEALDPGAPRLHESGNVLSVSRVQRGDVDAALAGAAHVVSETFRTQFIEHAFLEPESALAVPDEDGGLQRLLAGPGRLGRPPADRVVPRAARGAGAGHAGRRPAARSARRRT